MRIRLFPACALLLSSTLTAPAQTPNYPAKIRGYKVERAAVELKTTQTETKTANGGKSSTTSRSTAANAPPPATSSSANVDQLITFGKPSLARVTPLGITFNVPIVVVPIRQSGHVDFMLFEDMAVNDHSIEIDEYHRPFNLPTRQALTLREPLRFYINLPVAALAAIDEWTNSKDSWPVKGRVYVCGKFRKFVFSFKRCVPVELDLTMRNPLKG